MGSETGRPVYRRVLLKLSGEALLGGQPFGIEPAMVAGQPTIVIFAGLVSLPLVTPQMFDHRALQLEGGDAELQQAADLAASLHGQPFDALVSSDLLRARQTADVLVAVPHERDARVTELQLMALHGLCDAVDYQLMGDPEP